MRSIPKTTSPCWRTAPKRSVDAKSKKLVEQPDYVIDVIRRTGDEWYSGSQDRFRSHQPGSASPDHLRQKGNVATEADVPGLSRITTASAFPHVIEINRPQEEYSIRLTVVKLTINEPLKDDQFALEQPPGTQLVNLDRATRMPPPRARVQRSAPSHHGETWPRAPAHNRNELQPVAELEPQWTCAMPRD